MQGRRRERFEVTGMLGRGQVAFSGDGQTLAVLADRRTRRIDLCDTRSGKRTRQLEAPKNAVAVTFVLIWDVAGRRKGGRLSP